MTQIQWENIAAPATGANLMNDFRWFRARLPHGWLVQAVAPKKSLVGGREVVIEGAAGEGGSSTFVPFGPSPWN
jgi:hypothetical protein